MPRPPRSSPGSAPCRLEWRPSRWQCRAQLLIGALLPWALVASDLREGWGLPLGLLAMAAAWAQAWWQARQPPCAILLPAGEGAVRVDGEPVSELCLRSRGGLVQLGWRCPAGHRQWRLFWPDTLTPAKARELRLAAQAHCISRSPRAVAP